jgi:hypothetical protein
VLRAPSVHPLFPLIFTSPPPLCLTACTTRRGATTLRQPRCTTTPPPTATIPCPRPPAGTRACAHCTRAWSTTWPVGRERAFFFLHYMHFSAFSWLRFLLRSIYLALPCAATTLTPAPALALALALALAPGERTQVERGICGCHEFLEASLQQWCCLPTPPPSRRWCSCCAATTLAPLGECLPSTCPGYGCLCATFTRPLQLAPCALVLQLLPWNHHHLGRCHHRVSCLPLLWRPVLLAVDLSVLPT